MSYTFYKFIHLISIIGVIACIGAQIGYMFSEGSRDSFKQRKWLMGFHGLFAALLFIAGFGLMAKAQIKLSGNAWLFGKILLWLVLGMYPALLWKLTKNKDGSLNIGKLKMGFVKIFIFTGLALYLVLNKPF